MNLSFNRLQQIANVYGESFYILDSKQFTDNFNELQDAFRKIYPETYIAYSYKTNYTPKLCRIVNELGGFAEVVSEMEIEIAKRVGVPAEKIIFNGPYKNSAAIKKLLLDGVFVNIDSIEEAKFIESIANKNKSHIINVGVRSNFDIHDGVLSRFGIDTKGDDYDCIINMITKTKNIQLREMHCHFATRALETWTPRAEGMLDLIDEKLDTLPEAIDLGGGLFGKMGETLKTQFSSYIPTYDEYASAVAKLFAEKYGTLENMPKLVIEPGSALVGDCMKFAAKVTGIKKVRGKAIATLLGSIYNINPTLNTKNPPITVYHENDNDLKNYKNLDFGGFTCIETDYLYRNYSGKLKIGDYVVFDNVGSYSVVLKPPFILPNFAIIDCSWDDKEVELIKEAETFDDLFHTFRF